MDCKLPEDRPDDINVEDIRLRSFFGQSFHRLFVIFISNLLKFISVRKRKKTIPLPEK